jgi:hypothetical protein
MALDNPSLLRPAHLFSRGDIQGDGPYSGGQIWENALTILKTNVNWHYTLKRSGRITGKRRNELFWVGVGHLDHCRPHSRKEL